MTQTPSWPRGNKGLATAVLAACFGCVLLLDAMRGIWLDEATSFWLSGHDLAIGRIIRERWITDVHPPLYSAYAWMLQPLFGGSVQEMRLINLGGLWYAALSWRLAWRRKIDGDFLMLFAVLVASSPFFILYAAEFRSYFLQLALGACLIVQLRMVHEGKGGVALLGLTGLLLINLHYFGSLIGLILIGAEAIHLARSGRRRAALALLMIMAVATVPLAAAALAMLAAIEPVAVSNIPAFRALLAITATLGSAALPNLFAMAALRGRPPRADHSFMRVLAGALAAIASAYFLLNLATHNLLPRHMIAAVPIAPALVALMLEGRLKTHPRVFALICGNALLLMLAATAYGLANQRWESNVERIDAALRTCPQSRLHALNAMALLGPADKLRSVTGIGHFFGLTYRLIAKEKGWPVRIVPDGAAIAPVGACPALLWVEHLYARPGTSDMELARLGGFGGPIRVVRIQRGDARALLAISRTE